MDNKQVCEIIGRIESELVRHDCNSDYFAVVRVSLYFFLTSPVVRESKRPLHLSQVIRGFFNGAWRLLTLLRSPSSHLLVGASNQRNISNQSGLLSKHTDSLLAHLQKQEGIDLLEYGPVPPAQAGEHRANVSMFIDVISKSIILNGCTRKDVARICEVVANGCAGLQHRDRLNSMLRSNLLRYARLVGFFRVLFKIKSYDVAHFVVYYGVDALAMLRVIQENGGEAIDYQHGIQGRFQPMYSELSVIKERSPHSLPKHFWVWDEIAENRLLTASVNEKFHVAIVGRFWDQYYRDCLMYQSLPGGGCSLLAESGGKAVLVALQEFPEMFSDEVVKALAMLDESWVIVVRKHPRVQIHESLIKKYFSAERYRARVFFDEGSLDLAAVLNCVSCCVTGFSTVGLEAHMAGASVVFYHENALQGLSEYLALPGIHFADDAKSIYRLMNESYQANH